MSSNNYEANTYDHNLGLLIISHDLRVSYSTRSGCRDKSVQIARIYLSATPSSRQTNMYNNVTFQASRSVKTQSVKTDLDVFEDAFVVGIGEDIVDCVGGDPNFKP